MKSHEDEFADEAIEHTLKYYEILRAMFTGPMTRAEVAGAMTACMRAVVGLGAVCHLSDSQLRAFIDAVIDSKKDDVAGDSRQN